MFESCNDLFGLAANRDVNDKASASYFFDITNRSLEAPVRHPFGLARININNYSIPDMVIP